MYDAYLDIETTGLSRHYDDITVIGIYLNNDCDEKFVQMVGNDITKEHLLEALKDVGTIYTYNGSRFDLPFIRTSLDVDLTELFESHDLMYDCWQRNLRGGFKAVERQLGIPRQLKGIDGFDAVMLWWRYQNHGDLESLYLLLEYNREDVMNLKVLRERLSRIVSLDAYDSVI